MNIIKQQFELEIEMLGGLPSSYKANTKQVEYKNWLITNSISFSKHDVDLKESERFHNMFDTKIKQCFYNCWHGLFNRQLRYFEGFVASKKIPVVMEHAWMVTRDNKIIEPTFIIPTPLDEDRIPDDYFGMELDTDWVLKESAIVKKSGPYLIDYYVQEILNEKM